MKNWAPLDSGAGKFNREVLRKSAEMKIPSSQRKSSGQRSRTASARNLYCVSTEWRGRKAYRLGNNLMTLVCLTGGGHIAEFRLVDSHGPTANPMWVPPWKTIEPCHYSRYHVKRYGPPEIGKLMCGLVGHNLCLDYFGVPSKEEAACGLSILGEAPSSRWRKARLQTTKHAITLNLSVDLPIAGLRFFREITLREDETAAYFKETVINLRRADHFFHWVQHVTLGPEFLSPGHSYIVLPSKRGMTYPREYDGGPLLIAGREFQWPLAPRKTGGWADLSMPFSVPGCGFLVTALLDESRQTGFVAAVNSRQNLLVAYCFRRADYPWVALWEENGGRAESPWMRRCQARALEFGSTPFPLSRSEVFSSGTLFGTPMFAVVPAQGSRTIEYIGLLARLPERFGALKDIEVSRGEIRCSGQDGLLRLPASGLGGNPSRMVHPNLTNNCRLG